VRVLSRALAIPGSDKLKRMVCFKCWVERGVDAVSKLHIRARSLHQQCPVPWGYDVTAIVIRTDVEHTLAVPEILLDVHPTDTAKRGHTLTPGRKDDLALTRSRTPDTIGIRYDIHRM